MRALGAGDHLVLVGEMPCGHASQRLLERLVAEFAEIRDRRLLGVGRGVGGVERQIGRAALAGPLACAFQQHIRGLVDRGRIGRRCPLQAGIAQDVSGNADTEEGQQRDRRDKEIANTPYRSGSRGRIGRGHFLHP
ncbi:MAG TPA: hypothetical protein VI009_11750 [Xanthobacteraceae bacterium]